MRVKDIADFKIFTENAGAGLLDVKVIGPGILNRIFIKTCLFASSNSV